MQTAQAVHAAFLFSSEHPDVTDAWHRDSNYVVVLQVSDLASLHARYDRLPEHAPRVIVVEPDIGNEATAFATIGADSGRLLSDLPLALKEAAMV